MPLERIQIEAFRCIESAALDLDAQRNFIYGPNGAGKTSLLEAIYLLSRGRSFRTRQNRRLIRHGAAELTVMADVRADGRGRRASVRLGSQGLETRLDGRDGVGIAELAQVLPTHVIDPNVHALIEGGPSVRRRFLDWGVFHVEPEFLAAWRRFRRALGQRNAALKAEQETAAWDRWVIESGEVVNACRERYVARLAPVVAGVGETLLGRAVTVGYHRGWAADHSFAEALAASGPRDRDRRATQVGPHRADLAVALESQAVREQASRGQQKLVAAALVIGQVRLFADAFGGGGSLLVDDPTAELDQGASEALRSVLDTLPAQLVMTGLTESSLPPSPGSPVFHVERGEVHRMV